jgi:hypothetical protein
MEEHGRVINTREWGRKPFQMTVRAVCADCNNGCMHNLEVEAQRFMIGMVAGRGRVLHASGQRILTKWAIKTALMLEQLWPPDNRSIEPLHYRHLYENGAPLPGTRVWISSYDATQAALAAVTGFEVAVIDRPFPAGRNVFIWTFTIGPIAFQVFGTTVTSLHEMVVNWPSGSPIQQIHPYLGSLTWRPQPFLNDADMREFSNHILRGVVAQSESFEP